MLALVRDTIEPAIVDAHQDDQKLIDDAMAAISQVNKDGAVTIGLLQDRAVDIRSDIDSHNKLVAEWKAASGAFSKSLDTYENAIEDKTKTCCEKQQAAVPDLEVVAPYAECDYTVNTAAQCRAAAKAALEAKVQAHFVAGSEKYQRLNAACTSKANAIPAVRNDLDAKDKHCDGKEKATREASAQIQLDLPQLLSEWNHAKDEFENSYAQSKVDYLNLKATVQQQEADRKAEWDSTQEIKCMLVTFQEGGTFDDAALASCKKNIDHSHLNIAYPDMIPALQWVLAPFDDLDSSKAFASICKQVEQADEDADKKCQIDEEPPKPVCKNHLDQPVLPPIDHGPQQSPGLCDGVCRSRRMMGFTSHGLPHAPVDALRLHPSVAGVSAAMLSGPGLIVSR
jgi:hypothetical protein